MSRLQPPAVLSSLLAPLLLTGLTAPVIAQRLGSGDATLPAAPTGGPTVRVLLEQGPSWEIGPQAQRMRLLDGEGRPLRVLAVGEQLRLARTEAGVTVTLLGRDGLAVGLAPQPAGLILEPLVEKGQQGVLSFDGQRYRGRLQIRPGEAGRLMAINQLSLETYLASVVGSEMPASWPLPALEAQAVAARTYALNQLKPAAPFDLKDTVASQVYRGLAAETDSTRAAVASTRGRVLMQGGRLIQAVFHSSSGGVTEDSGQVWRHQLPYLVSVPDFDRDSPVSRWNLRLEPEQLRTLFREIGGVRSIDVLSSSGSGRVKLARVVGPTGSLQLSGSELRQRLGLRSTLVTFTLQPVTPSATTGVIDQAVRGSRPAEAEPRPMAAPAVATPASSDGNSAEEPPRDSASGVGARRQEAPPTGSIGPVPGPRPLFGTAATSPQAQPGYALLVEGRGFGHGVGMSQWGAYAMARAGRTYEQILRHYYRGVELSSYPNP